MTSPRCAHVVSSGFGGLQWCDQDRDDDDATRFNAGRFSHHHTILDSQLVLSSLFVCFAHLRGACETDASGGIEHAMINDAIANGLWWAKPEARSELENGCVWVPMLDEKEGDRDGPLRPRR